MKPRTPRNLISKYKIFKYNFYSLKDDNGIEDNQETEEFGTETLTRVIKRDRSPSYSTSSHQKDIQLKSKSNFKRKKMHMYADEINSDDSDKNSSDNKDEEPPLKRKK